ncbi:MAG: transposase domain-containing protein [Nitrosomonas sp.]|nr:transposase domain-containing protein [Nitrosomonas sp.]
MHDWLLQTRPNRQWRRHRQSHRLHLEALAKLCYANSGNLPIDNNPVENTIRPIALGKKTGCSPAPNAPENAAAIQTPAGTAKLNGLNPTEWLADTLEKTPRLA